MLIMTFSTFFDKRLRFFLAYHLHTCLLVYLFTRLLVYSSTYLLVNSSTCLLVYLSTRLLFIPFLSSEAFFYYFSFIQGDNQHFQNLRKLNIVI